MGVIKSLYPLIVLKYAKAVLLVCFLVLLFLASELRQFAFDASGDALLLEDDKDLVNYRTLLRNYPSSDDFLVVVYQPPENSVFDAEVLQTLQTLKRQLITVPGVQRVNSVLDVPVLDHPDIDLTNVSQYTRTVGDLLSGGELRDPARLEQLRSYFVNHPLYKELLVSLDGGTTAMQVVLKKDAMRTALIEEREKLRSRERADSLNQTQSKRLSALESLIKAENAESVDEHGAVVSRIRTVLEPFDGQARVFLGGVPMIVVDMLDFVKKDLKRFGVAVILFLILTLAVIFRRFRWVILALFCCILSSATLSGILAWQQFPITVISSNYVSLIFIISMSMVIHLIVHYREVALSHRDEFLSLSDRGSTAIQFEMVRQTVSRMFWPIFYSALTTIVAFSSLVFSQIRPIIDFGLMMSLGIAVAFFVAFVIFPALLMMLRPTSPRQRERHITDVDDVDQNPLSMLFVAVTEKLGNKLLVISIIMVIFSVYGISKLSVENRFIDYFKEDTEIHQGMKLIDQKLGGTTPLEIVIRFPEVAEAAKLANQSSEDNTSDCFIDDNCLENTAADAQLLTTSRVNLLHRIHDYLSDIEGVGKVLSISTTLRILEEVNRRPLSSVELSLLDSVFPSDLRPILLDPYIHYARYEFRFNLRVLDSDKDLVRAELMKKIRADLVEQFDLKQDQLLITGMLVMYNNMLQSLFSSQIKTIGFVFLGIMCMFLLLFRSFKLALAGILPNIVSACFVLGLMGWLNIPLDIMSITIAAITVGIAVDDTIHYIYRFKEEYAKTRDYAAAMRASHASIGKAMYYTTATIIVGFSILMMSSFTPTVYFGLFTSLAMLIAFLSSMTLLPQLLIRFRCME